MEVKIRKFKKILEETVIPEIMPYEERVPLLKPLVEYAHNIIPQKLFRYRECSEIQFDAFNKNLIYAVNVHIPEHTRSLSGSLLRHKTRP